MTISESAYTDIEDGSDTRHWFREFRRYLGLSAREMRLMRGKITDESRPVDEEMSGLPSPISLHPDFDTVDELITSILVSTPVNGLSADATGQVTAPAAGATITSATVQPGNYSVPWDVTLTGAAAAADEDNFGLFLNNVLIATSANPAIAGNYPQDPVDISPLTAQVLAVKAIGNGTAAVVYSANFAANPLNGNVTLQLGTRALTLQPGLQVIAPIRMLLGKTDQRVLTWTNPGNGNLEIMGFAAGDSG